MSKRLCEDCGSYYTGYKCDCQKTKKIVDTMCAYENMGDRCDKKGVLSNSIYGQGPYYCRWHHYCMTYGYTDNDRKEYQAFLEREKELVNMPSNYIQEDKEVKWYNDEDFRNKISKFVISKGSNSWFWKSAPDFIKNYILDYYKKGE